MCSSIGKLFTKIALCQGLVTSAASTGLEARKEAEMKEQKYLAL